jgi:DNA-binding NtrC family response regulator
VWAGNEARVRRAAPESASGPPWWDITFVPLLGSGERRVLGVVGLLTVVGPSRTLPRVKVPAAVAAVRANHAARYTFDLLAGPSPVSERLASQSRAAAACEVSVWVHGEPGAGKETVARVIHHNSPRRERAFVGLPCGGLQPYILEGMLFGKGGLAGTPVVGTLYLNRPEELLRPLQDRILWWCESAFGPRLMCGSTAMAEELVKGGRLAPTFYTRHAPFDIRVPPLRERPDDLPLIASRLLPGTAEPEAITALRGYHWPGNWRELLDVLAPADGQPLRKDHLPRVIRERLLVGHTPALAKPPPKLDEVLETVERRMISAALAKTGGRLADAAELLGVWRARLSRRIAALGLGGEPEEEA